MSKVFIAGHKGMVGSAICRAYEQHSTVEIITRDRQQLDLLDQQAVQAFFTQNPVDKLIIAAAKVGGIQANNTLPAEFIYQNLMIESNLINAAHQADVQHLLFLGSSCIYPGNISRPIKEEDLLQGPLESSNEPYAIAKIAGIKLCESYNRQYGRDYRSIMPCNLYGPQDNFHAEHSHVIPALLRKFHDAHKQSLAEVEIWGSGKPRREFLHVDDMAAACLHVLSVSTDIYDSHTDAMCSHLNVGTGSDCSISELATLIAEISGFKGSLAFNTSKPDGTARKLLDCSKINALGWASSISLKSGLEQTYQWYLDHLSEARS